MTSFLSWIASMAGAVFAMFVLVRLGREYGRIHRGEANWFRERGIALGEKWGKKSRREPDDGEKRF